MPCIEEQLREPVEPTSELGIQIGELRVLGQQLRILDRQLKVGDHLIGLVDQELRVLQFITNQGDEQLPRLFLIA